jgi:hypothetical protein
MNVYWCPQCDEGYQAEHEGCPRCGDEAKPEPKPKEIDTGLAAGCVAAAFAVALVLGFALGFLVRGCV